MEVKLHGICQSSSNGSVGNLGQARYLHNQDFPAVGLQWMQTFHW